MIFKITSAGVVRDGTTAFQLTHTRDDGTEVPMGTIAARGELTDVLQWATERGRAVTITHE